MKKLLIFLLLLLNTICYARDSTVIQLSDTNKLTLLKVYTDVKNGITGLATALKVPATHVYEILVKQQIVYSVSWISTLLLLIIPYVFLIKSMWVFGKRNSNNSDGASYILPILWGIINVAFFLIFLMNISYIIGGLVNPEYGAIKDILKFIK